MAIFNRKKKQEEAQKAPVAKPSTPSASDTKAAPKKSESSASPSAKATGDKVPKKEIRTDARAAHYASLLLKPHVSEKAAVLADKGVYVFDVPLTANKIEIGKAVEAIYGVHVKKVRTERGIGKTVRRGRKLGHRNAWKKALVELKNGETISLVEGV